MIAVLTPVLISMGALGLLVVVAVVFVETGLIVGSFLPGDSLLVTVGVLVASHVMALPLWLVVAACAAAAVAGDQVGYGLGRRFGAAVFSRSHSRLLNPRHVVKAHEFFARHGSLAVVLARFVPVVRGLTPPVAGMGRMPYRRFAVYNIVGGVAWTSLLLVAGFYAGGVPLVARHVELLAVGLVVASLVPTGVMWWRRTRARPLSAVSASGPGRTAPAKGRRLLRSRAHGPHATATTARAARPGPAARRRPRRWPGPSRPAGAR